MGDPRFAFKLTEVRGEQPSQQVLEIRAISGAPKVNLIGHSHGGPTIRYVAGVRPDVVASPDQHRRPAQGSPVADLVMKAEGTPAEAPLAGAVNLFSKAITWAQGLDPDSYPHDALAGGKSLTLRSARLSSRQIPLRHAGIRLRGRQAAGSGRLQLFICRRGHRDQPAGPGLRLKLTSLLIDGGKDNDGLVSKCSAKFGKTVRDDYNWNHLDEVNQVLGLKALFAPDPVDVYRQHASRLKLQGL